MQTQAAKVVLILIIVILVVTYFVPLLNARDNLGKEIVESETMACVVSACVLNKALGEECLILKPRVSKIRTTIDADGYRRITILPTSVDCTHTSP